jgi:hypothetical protein
VLHIYIYDISNLRVKVGNNKNPITKWSDSIKRRESSPTHSNGKEQKIHYLDVDIYITACDTWCLKKNILIKKVEVHILKKKVKVHNQYGDKKLSVKYVPRKCVLHSIMFNYQLAVSSYIHLFFPFSMVIYHIHTIHYPLESIINTF